MTNDILKFELPKDQSSIIKVFGVGGGGCNAVKHMYEQGIKGVDFIVCNTDAQSLETNPVPFKIQIGEKGLGAGSVPTVGKEAARKDIEKLKSALEHNTEMIFITAGMGGGTGTGAAPVLAELAKEMGILTVGIVTLPFGFEGRKRREYADAGINELKQHVDALLVICNDKLRELYGNLGVTDAFNKADNILTTAAKSIAEIITNEGLINVDLEDVKTVMRESGVAIMGSGKASGENRAHEAVEQALKSPLLNDSNITGAKNILLYLAYGNEMLSMDEITEITDYVNDEAGTDANVIWGYGIDSELDSEITVTLIATGFNPSSELNSTADSSVKSKIHPLKIHPVSENSERREPKSITNFEVLQKNTDGDSSQPDITNGPLAATTSSSATIVHNLFDEPQNAKLLETENSLYPSLKSSSANENETSTPVTDFQISESAQDNSDAINNSRAEVLKKYNTMLKTEAGLVSIENTPAYLRKGIQINDSMSSTEKQSSSLRIAQTDDNQVAIERKNPYLFDNVD